MFNNRVCSPSRGSDPCECTRSYPSGRLSVSSCSARRPAGGSDPRTEASSPSRRPGRGAGRSPWSFPSSAEAHCGQSAECLAEAPPQSSWRSHRALPGRRHRSQEGEPRQQGQEALLHLQGDRQRLDPSVFRRCHWQHRSCLQKQAYRQTPLSQARHREPQPLREERIGMLWPAPAFYLIEPNKIEAHLSVSCVYKNYPICSNVCGSCSCNKAPHTPCSPHGG
jgi:hypothetical protein